MIYTLLTSFLLLSPQEPVAKVEIPVAKAAQALTEALKSKDPALAVDALLEHGKRADSVITKAVALGFKQKNAQVLAATIQALRFNPDPSSVTELLKQKRQKKIVEDLELGPAYFTALGQQGSPKAFSVLSKSLRQSRGAEAKFTEARILALGRVRELRSIEVLLKLQRSGGGGSGRRGGGGRGPFRNQVQLALMALTGEDPGSSTLDWTKWWSDNKKGFRISKKEEFPEGKQKKLWTRLWADPNAEAEARANAKKDRKKDRKKGSAQGKGDRGAGEA